MAGEGLKEIIERVGASGRQKEAKQEEQVQLVTFELDNEEYGSLITDLREIIKIPEIVPAPGAPPFIKGIINLRGQVVVIIDLEQRFALKRDNALFEPKHIVIVEIQDSVFGVIVDEVTGVIRVPVSSIKPTPSLISSKIHAEYLRGVVILADEEKEASKNRKGSDIKEKSTKEGPEKNSRLILLLDIPKMLSDKEMLQFSNLIEEELPKVVENSSELK
jgi:purine-binding chemotaxis protein CheW